MAEQMLSIHVRAVLSLVEVNHQTIRLLQEGDSLYLLLRVVQRGCTGPEAAAVIYPRQAREDRPTAKPQLLEAWYEASMSALLRVHCTGALFSSRHLLLVS
jgi:hypothetical protein